MKRKLYKITAILLLAVMMLSLFACENESDSSGKMTLVLAGDSLTTYEVDLGEIEIKKGLVSVFEYLKREKGLEYEISGTYLNKVGELENDGAAGKYIYIYTSVTSDMDVSQYAMTVEYEGKTLTSSGVGANEMRIEDGCVIYIGYISW